MDSIYRSGIYQKLFAGKLDREAAERAGRLKMQLSLMNALR